MVLSLCIKNPSILATRNYVNMPVGLAFLPFEMLEHIVSYLDMPDVNALSRIRCKALRAQVCKRHCEDMELFIRLPTIQETRANTYATTAPPRLTAGAPGCLKGVMPPEWTRGQAVRQLTISGGYKKGERDQADTSPHGFKHLLRALCTFLRSCPGLVHLTLRMRFKSGVYYTIPESCRDEFAEVARIMCALRNLKAFTCRVHDYRDFIWIDILPSSIWHEMHRLDIDLLGVYPTTTQLRSGHQPSPSDLNSDRSP